LSLPSVDYQRYRTIAWLHDHDLVARDEELVLAQLAHPIKDERWKLMQVDIRRYLSSERQTQPQPSAQPLA
jgi:hypothetical protein